jgi:predicted transcriptional regulator
MSSFLELLDSEGRVPASRQTRIAAFLISAHAALTRQLAVAVPLHLHAGWETELNAQLYREAEIVSLLLRATSWVPDLAIPLMAMSWEAAWLPKPATGMADATEGLMIDMAALGHALHAAIRPAALLPLEASAQDPFVVALRRIEFESGRLMQAQILFLKSPRLLPVRDAVNAAVERRHAQVSELWITMLESIGMRRDQPAPQQA